MTILKYITYGYCFLLVACANQHVVDYQSKNSSVDTTYVQQELATLIQPYRSEVDSLMGQIIGTSTEAMSKAQPESTLGNFVADIVYASGYQLAKEEIGETFTHQNTFALINYGGLRASLSKGDISIGDVFQLMPFDNTISILKLPASRMPDMIEYMKLSNGQPVGNLQLVYDKTTAKVFIGNELFTAPYFFVITSNYLAGGGDKMNFLLAPEQEWVFKNLIRDEIIKYIQLKEVIVPPTVGNRMKFSGP